jgi:hypothetical protein
VQAAGASCIPSGMEGCLHALKQKRSFYDMGLQSGCNSTATIKMKKSRHLQTLLNETANKCVFYLQTLLNFTISNRLWMSASDQSSPQAKACSYKFSSQIKALGFISADSEICLNPIHKNFG